MNTRTVLSQSPGFMEKWKKYKKKFPGVKEWYIASDYCLNKDSDKPTKVMTFTLCPAVDLERLQNQISHSLKSDIKEHKNFSDSEIQFIRDNEFFFSIVVEVKKQGSVLEDKLKAELDPWIKRIEEESTEENLTKRLKKFHFLRQYLNQNSHSTDLVTKIILVSFIIGVIIEFLIVKHNAQKILWISDRGKIIDFDDGLVIELSNMNYHNLVKGRTRQEILFGVAREDTVSKRFNFDPMIRYPDIISGVISSTDLEKNTSEGGKHFDMFVNAIAGNERISFFILQKGIFKEGYIIDKLKKGNVILRSSCVKKTP